MGLEYRDDLKILIIITKYSLFYYKPFLKIIINYLHKCIHLKSSILLNNTVSLSELIERVHLNSVTAYFKIKPFVLFTENVKNYIQLFTFNVYIKLV